MADTTGNPPQQTDASFGVIPVYVGKAASPREAEYLLIQHHAGHWGFPKGHAEAGESARQAAARELIEETGLSGVKVLEHPRFEEAYVFRSRRGVMMRKTVTFFLGRVADRTVKIQPEEIRDAAWGDAEATRRRMTYEEGRLLFDDALRALEAIEWFKV